MCKEISPHEERNICSYVGSLLCMKLPAKDKWMMDCCMSFTGEVFTVPNNYSPGISLWLQVSSEVIPINVYCFHNSKENMLHLTGWSGFVYKVFDTKVFQGSKFLQDPERPTFVYWNDSKSERYWGINFQNVNDANEFREICINNISV